MSRLLCRRRRVNRQVPVFTIHAAQATHQLIYPFAGLGCDLLTESQ